MKRLLTLSLSLILGLSFAFAATTSTESTATTTVSQKKKSTTSSGAATFNALMKEMAVYCDKVEVFCQQVAAGELTDSQINTRLASLQKMGKAMEGKLNKVRTMNLTQSQQMQLIEILARMADYENCISYYDL